MDVAVASPTSYAVLAGEASRCADATQHSVPARGGDRMVVLTFSNPIAVLAVAFAAQLSDALVQSLRFTR